MTIGAELRSERGLSVDDTTYFEMTIEVDGEPVAASRGIDRYLLNGFVLPSKRVAATGRPAMYSLSDTGAGLGLGPIEAAPAALCPLTFSPGLRLVIAVKNNAVLDPGVFCLEFSLGLSASGPAGGKAYDFSLRRPDIAMSWPSRGVFKFDVTEALDLWAES
ncbi:MAG: hypothetical protein HPY55_09880 [Firmicutes bacterium]|nr:hypothetical protein [Bacillota bacterium]